MCSKVQCSYCANQDEVSQVDSSQKQCLCDELRSWSFEYPGNNGPTFRAFLVVSALKKKWRGAFSMRGKIMIKIQNTGVQHPEKSKNMGEFAFEHYI